MDVGPDGTLYFGGSALDTTLGHIFAKSTNAQDNAVSPTIDFVTGVDLGGSTGFASGMARMSLPGWPWALAGCLAVSMSLHFLWDAIALAARGVGAMTAWQTAGAVGLMGSGILFYGMLVVRGSAWSRQIFDPLSPRRLWGWPLTLLVRDHPSR